MDNDEFKHFWSLFHFAFSYIFFLVPHSLNSPSRSLAQLPAYNTTFLIVMCISCHTFMYYSIYTRGYVYDLYLENSKQYDTPKFSSYYHHFFFLRRQFFVCLSSFFVLCNPSPFPSTLFIFSSLPLQTKT